MNPNGFTLGSSFFTGGPRNVPDLSLEWCLNLTRMDVQPAHTVIICEGGTKLNYYPPRASILHLDGNLGNWEDVMRNRVPNEWSGWSASMVALAMIAHVNNTDFVYRESDCFLFGRCIQQAYEDMGDGSFIFGPAMKSAPYMASAQSFFIVKHAFICHFVSAYLALGGERTEMNLGEMKFVKLEQQFGTKIVHRLSFGVDRERPIPWTAPAFYFQQATVGELTEAKTRGLL